MCADTLGAGPPTATPDGSPERTDVRRFAALFDSVPSARRHAAEVIRSWAPDAVDEVTERAESLTTELVTNAIKASIDPDGPRTPRGRQDEIVLRLTSRGMSLVIEVWDCDDTPPVLMTADPDAEGGRGLVIVDVLSTRWGYRAGNGGKVVWCEVILADQVPHDKDFPL
jgi:hypothetical protein